MPTNELTNVERKKLFDGAKKIHAHKLMQAKVFEILARKTKDEIIKQLLLRIGADEASHADARAHKQQRFRFTKSVALFFLQKRQY